MIINKEQAQEAEYIGDIQEHRVGIDKENINFITTLLTSNLYSQPLASFLRETVANAQDSQVEAGSTDKILLLIQDTKNYDKYRVSVRDYGTGVSPEKFNTIYKNIGSSTKRESNDYIGMFGIGRFSCLACADTAHITSYYQGKRYSYVMYKNGSGINIDQISVIDTDARDGLEVSLETRIEDCRILKSALKGLSLFDSLFVSYEGERYGFKDVVSDFNARVVNYYNTFATCSLCNSNNFFRVGNVIYNCDSSHDTLCTSGIIITLPMGAVDITPNREALQYTDTTCKSIETAITAVKQELNDLVKTLYNKDLSLKAFCQDLYFAKEYIVSPNLHIDLKDAEVDWSAITIQGESLPAQYSDFLSSTKYKYVDKAYVYKVFNANRRGLSYCFKNFICGEVNAAQKADKQMTSVTKEYYEDSLKECTVVFTEEGWTLYWQELLKEAAYWGNNEAHDQQEYVKCLEFTLRHLPLLQIHNSDVPEDYKTTYQAAHKVKASLDPNKIPINHYVGNVYNREYFHSSEETLYYIYTAHTTNDAPLRSLGQLCLAGAPIYVFTVTSSRLPLFADREKEGFITLENFLYLQNAFLTRLCTAFVINGKLKSFNENPDFSVYRTPIYTKFLAEYDKEMSIINRMSYTYFLKEWAEYYKSKGWLNQRDIEYYDLSEEEVKAYIGWQQLKEKQTYIIRSIARKKFGKHSKIGLI